MIKIFEEKDKQLILDFAYQREKENLFIIGSLEKDNTFKDHIYLGYYYNNKLEVISSFFGKWKSFITNSQNKEIINEFVNFILDKKLIIKSVIPTYSKYGLQIIEYLKQKNIYPKEENEIVFLNLTKSNFNDFSKGYEILAQKKDIENIVYLQRILSNENLDNQRPKGRGFTATHVLDLLPCRAIIRSFRFLILLFSNIITYYLIINFSYSCYKISVSPKYWFPV